MSVYHRYSEPSVAAEIRFQLRQVMHARGITNSDIAKATGRSLGYINNVIAGGASLTRTKPTRMAIEKFLGQQFWPDLFV